MGGVKKRLQTCHQESITNNKIGGTRLKFPFCTSMQGMFFWIRVQACCTYSILSQQLNRHGNQETMRSLNVTTIICYLAFILARGDIFANAFQSARHIHKKNTSCQFKSSPSCSKRKNPQFDRSIGLSGGFLDDVQGFFKRFTTKAEANHILIKGGAEAANKLEDLKAEIGDSPISFAQAASQYSECPSASRGGDLGSFGPGAMVKEFDTVVFNEPIGVVHGPIKTQFGYHLIYIRSRTE